MKKLFFAFVVISLFVLSACSEQTESGNDAQDSQQVQDSANSSDENGDTLSEEAGNNLSEEENSEAGNGVYGEVHEVIGNMLVLDVVDMPKGIQNRMTGEGAQNFNIEDMSEEDRQEMQDRIRERSGISEEEFSQIQENFQNGDFSTMPGRTNSEDGAVIQRGEWSGEMPEGFEIPEGGMVFGGFIDGENGDITRGNVISERAELNYTGEQIEVIIPVGVPVVTYGFSNEGLTETETDMSNVKSGSVIMISYNENGAVSKVTLVY